MLAVVAVVACVFGTVGCRGEASVGSEAAASTTPDEPNRLPAGWPEILALDPNAEIDFVADNSQNGEIHQVVIAEVDGIGQQVFGVYADALDSVGYAVTIDAVSHDTADLRWALHAAKGPHAVTVQVSGSDDGRVTVRFTHDVESVPEGRSPADSGNVDGTSHTSDVHRGMRVKFVTTW
ncbi:MAG TPA: hypothetical protein VFN21_11490 [Acidimicrobiales bacterium]|nr:hypothetical protein [Acidimicrobiales bacterium]